MSKTKLQVADGEGLQVWSSNNTKVGLFKHTTGGINQIISDSGDSFVIGGLERVSIAPLGSIYVTGNPAGYSILGFPTSVANSDWRMGHDTGSFLGVDDPLFAIGYNVAFSGGGFNRVNLSDSAHYYALEGNYRVDLGNGLGVESYLEAYTEFIGSGGNSTRGIMMNVLKSDPKLWTVVQIGIAGTNSQFDILDKTGADANILTVYKNGPGMKLFGYFGINVDPTATYRLNAEETVAGTSCCLRIGQTATSGTSNSKLLIQTAAGGGDPFINFVAGATEFSFGQDNSVSGDPIKLSASGVLGTTDVLTIPTTGDATLLGSLTVTGNPDASGHLLFGAPTGAASVSWRLAHFNNNFLTIDDPTLLFGYNVSNTGGKDNAADAANFIGLEGRYRADLSNGLGAVDYLEFYNTMVSVGGVSVRPFVTTALKSNPETFLSTQMGISGTTGYLTIINEATDASILNIFVNGPAMQLSGYMGINVVPTTSYRLNSEETAVGTSAVWRLGQTATSGASDAKFLIQTAAGGGDPFINIVAGATDWSIGADNSVASDPFTISASGTLGTTNVLSITTAGVVNIPNLTASTFVFTDASKNLTSTAAGTLGVANGGTGASTFTSGSVVFAGSSGVYTQDNTNFFWDDTNNDLTIGSTGLDTINRLTINLGDGTGLTDASSIGINIVTGTPSFDTTSSTLNFLGMYMDLDATRSAGANTLNMYGFYSDVTSATGIAVHAFYSEVKGTNSSAGFNVLNSSTGASNYGLLSVCSGAGTTNITAYLQSSGATTNYSLYCATGDIRLGDSGIKIGFFGTAPAVKPTVSGSRGANAALASLLTALAGLGLLTDSSS